jgi:DNA-directed RNA polymerase specialized sigma24 family protein
VPTQALQAVTVTKRGSEPAATPRRSKRLRRPYHSLFEAIACNRIGTKVDGIAYRNGRLSRDAACYQFRDGQANGVAGNHTLTVLVQKRLGELLAAKDIDLLYLRFVAGWSQAEIARERGCHRSTIKRRENRLLQTLRADPLLRRAAGASA